MHNASATSGKAKRQKDEWRRAPRVVVVNVDMNVIIVTARHSFKPSKYEWFRARFAEMRLVVS